MLEEDIIADGIDEGSEAFRLSQCARLVQTSEDAGKGFLTHVLNCVGRLEPRAKLQMEQLGEVADEVLLGARIPGAEVFDVICIERMELQGWPRKPERT